MIADKACAERGCACYDSRDGEEGVEMTPEPLAPLIAGAIFDFAGFLTTRTKVIEVGSSANSGPMVELIKQWAEHNGLSLKDAQVLNWEKALKP